MVQKKFVTLRTIFETVVKELQKYTITISSLENKSYEFDFESGDAFFEAMEQDLIQRGSFKTQLVLTKSSSMIQLNFHIRGTVELTCDRSLELFDEPFDIREQLFLKYADRTEELTDEIELIQWDTQQINVARYLFDFIVLSLPMKKLHPRFRDEEAGESDDQEGKVVYRSEPSEPDAEEGEPPIDPRWDLLRKLTNN
ncbi:YceD family protein [Larkinella sp. VNQ87]|uniref:YceD family protein n=1 Tax=Larkinella sp. VNQ87 TaxID=3400921 RepID=UPI003BFF2CF1